MKFWIYLLLALGCATVEKKEGLKVATIAPILDESIFSEGKENIPSYDYKYRKVKNEYPIYSFYPITYPESFPKELKELFKEEMVQLWNRTGARFEDVSKEIFSDRNKLLSVSEKLQLDAFIRCLWKEKEGVYSIEEEIVDPITERVSAVVSFQIKVLRPKKNAKKNEWLIYRGKETFTVLEEKTSPELKFVSLPTSDTLKKAIDSSFFANLNVYTSSQETNVKIEDTKIEKIPATNLIWKPGKTKFVYSKKGNEPVTKELTLRGGEKKDVFLGWKDDITYGSLKVNSFPKKNLEVSLNNSIYGGLPITINGLSPNWLNLEFILNKNNKKFSFYLSQAEVLAGRSIEITLPYDLQNAFSKDNREFWKETNNLQIKPIFEYGLGFLNESGNSILEWQGLESKPFLADEIKIEGGFIPVEGMFQGNCMLGIKTGINLHAIEVEAERVSIFHFPDNNISKSVYVFKTTEKSEARKFRMETNRKENKVKIFFGYTQVYEGFANFESVWKLVALARGDIFSKVNCFSELSVTYPELVKKIQLFEENK